MILSIMIFSLMVSTLNTDDTITDYMLDIPVLYEEYEETEPTALIHVVNLPYASAGGGYSRN